MKSASYRKMGACIQCKQEFIDTTVRGFKATNGDYVIYSYRRPILLIKDTGDIVFDDRYYSATTGKIQYIIAQLLRDTKGWKQAVKIGPRGGEHSLRLLYRTVNNGTEWEYQQAAMLEDAWDNDLYHFMKSDRGWANMLK